MLLGPAGCGKSTLLARTKREAAAAGKPVVLVQWRLPEGFSSGAAASGTAAADFAILHASDALFQQIDFPPRRAFIVTAFKTAVLALGLRMPPDEALPLDRLLFALTVLFREAAVVSAARVAVGAKSFDAAPFLLFDEAHDLVMDERLARAGGAAIFRQLAALINYYCVNRRAVRVIVAGSTAGLAAAFQRSPPNGSRWRHFELPDPAPGAVAAALEARGYAPSEAHALIGECGTRLRLLKGPLLRGAGAVGAADVIAASVFTGDSAVAALFDGLAAADAALLSRMLDAVAAVDEAATAGARRPRVDDLPAAARASSIALTSVVEEDYFGSAFFESRPIALAWARARGPLLEKLGLL
jgi:hypothetical protein